MSTILFSIQNGVASIILNRPDKLNAFNREMAKDLQNKLDECKQETVRAVLITGAGKGFSAGQDLAEAVATKDAVMETMLGEYYNPIISRIMQLEKPVVAAVNGVAAGAGANIALACDVVVASKSASFIQAFSKIGLIPDSGGTFILPRLIGWQKASALMMLGEKISATDAEKMGMIYKVFDDESFKEESTTMANTLARLPTKALALIKKSLTLSVGNNVEAQLDVEDKFQQIAASSNDFKEGIQAFLEKRSPVFKGN